MVLLEHAGAANLVLIAACSNVGPYTKSPLSELLRRIGMASHEQTTADHFTTHLLHLTLCPWLNGHHCASRRSSVGVRRVFA